MVVVLPSGKVRNLLSNGRYTIFRACFLPESRPFYFKMQRNEIRKSNMVVANVLKADSVLSEYLLLQQKAADRNG